MSYDFTFYYDEPYLLFVLSGRVDSVEQVLAYTAAIIEEATAKGYDAVLVDERAAQISIEQFEAIQIADAYDARYIQLLGIRGAVVVDPKDAERAHSLETAYANRSLPIKYYTDVDEAKRWLLEKRDAGRG